MALVSQVLRLVTTWLMLLAAVAVLDLSAARSEYSDDGMVPPEARPEVSVLICVLTPELPALRRLASMAPSELAAPLMACADRFGADFSPLSPLTWLTGCS